MKLRNLIFNSLFILASLNLSAQLQVTSLTTDYKTNPIGIDNPSPSLSWIIQSDQNNTMQESYEIRAALNPDDLFKKVKSTLEFGNCSIFAEYSYKVSGSGPQISPAYILAGSGSGQSRKEK